MFTPPRIADAPFFFGSSIRSMYIVISDQAIIYVEFDSYQRRMFFLNICASALYPTLQETSKKIPSTAELTTNRQLPLGVAILIVDKPKSGLDFRFQIVEHLNTVLLLGRESGQKEEKIKNYKKKALKYHKCCF